MFREVHFRDLLNFLWLNRTGKYVIYMRCRYSCQAKIERGNRNVLLTVCESIVFGVWGLVGCWGDARIIKILTISISRGLLESRNFGCRFALKSGWVHMTCRRNLNLIWSTYLEKEGWCWRVLARVTWLKLIYIWHAHLLCALSWLNHFELVRNVLFTFVFLYFLVGSSVNSGWNVNCDEHWLKL